MRVVPEKTDTGSDHCRAKDREFACSLQVRNQQIGTSVDASEDVCEHAERQQCDCNETRRQSVESVGEIHRIADTCQNERHPWHIQKRKPR